MINRLTSGFALSARPEARPGPDGFAHQKFRLARNDIILEFTDALVAKPLVKLLRSKIEAGDAQEDIRAFPKNPFLGKLHQLRANAATAPSRRDNQGLDVANECSLHVQRHMTREGFAYARNIDFAGAVAEEIERMFEIPLQGDPWFRLRHQFGAGAGLFRVPERLDDRARRIGVDLIRCFHDDRLNNFSTKKQSIHKGPLPFGSGNMKMHVQPKETISETRPGRAAQIEKREENGRGWADDLREFTTNRKFLCCCPERFRGSPSLRQHTLISSPTKVDGNHKIPQLESGNWGILHFWFECVERIPFAIPIDCRDGMAMTLGMEPLRTILIYFLGH